MLKFQNGATIQRPDRPTNPTVPKSKHHSQTPHSAQILLPSSTRSQILRRTAIAYPHDARSVKQTNALGPEISYDTIVQ